MSLPEQSFSRYYSGHGVSTSNYDIVTYIFCNLVVPEKISLKIKVLTAALDRVMMKIKELVLHFVNEATAFIVE